ncbi:hypothetical protein PCC6912_48230 [Chlorogloeopsis fritschii PCC 6912]|uniref:Uncharacterized protein n=1 Tax=Chlorogloeopsis fritschii PCC 6912 TaxID=211165 RepID=A0A433N2F6_CHLFR|nr:hypothetical protein PCC6912_48230 [Chlorogloeopsis fritschii PCC 6912]
MGCQPENTAAKVFRELKNGQYTTEMTLTTGTISALAFPDVSIEVERLIGVAKRSKEL